MKSSQANVDTSQTEPEGSWRVWETLHYRNAGTLIKAKGLALLLCLSTGQLWALPCIHFLILVAERNNGGILQGHKSLSWFIDKGRYCKGDRNTNQQDEVPGPHLQHFLYTSVYHPHFTDAETGTCGYTAGPADHTVRSNTNTFLLSTHSWSESRV